MTVRRPSRRSHLAAVALVPVLALLAACTGGDDGTPAAASGQELKIGLLTPLKGPDAISGTDARRGAQLAVDIINGINPSVPLPLAAGAGLPKLGGAKVTLAVEDANPTAENDAQVTAGNAVSRLVSVEGVDALIGAYDPLVTEYASQRSERYEVPFINADSPATYLTDAGRDWFFRIGPSWRSAGEAFFSLLRQSDVKPGKMVVMHSRDKVGQDVLTTVRELAAEVDPTATVGDVAFDPGATDFTAKVDELIAKKPDTLFLYGPSTSVLPLTQAFVARAYKPKVALSGYVEAKGFAGNSAVLDGVLRSVSWSKESAQRNPAAQVITDLYRSRFNGDMTEAAASAFTAVMTVAQAVDNAGATENQRVRSALLSLNVPGAQTIMPWSGIRFDETHQNVLAQALIEQFANGAFTIVYPRDATAAGTAMVYPAPNSG